VDGYQSTIIFQVDDTPKNNLEPRSWTQTGQSADGTKDVHTGIGRRVSISSIAKRMNLMCASIRPEGSRIRASTRGDAPGGRLERAAHKLPQNLFCAIFAHRSFSYESGKRKPTPTTPQSRDWSFTWERRGSRQDVLRLNVMRAGDVVSQYKAYLKRSERVPSKQGARGTRRLRSSNNLSVIALSITLFSRRMSLRDYFACDAAVCLSGARVSRRRFPGRSVFISDDDLSGRWSAPGMTRTLLYSRILAEANGKDAVPAKHVRRSGCSPQCRGNHLYRVSQPDKIRLDVVCNWAGISTKKNSSSRERQYRNICPGCGTQHPATSRVLYRQRKSELGGRRI